VQLQISRTAKPKAKKLLEYRLITTYLESFVDLDAKPEPTAVIICSQEYASAVVFREMDKMNDNIISNYPQVKNVTVYGRDAFIREFDKPGATFPKSTVIGKYEPHDNDLATTISRVESDTLFDVIDAIFERDRIRHGRAIGNSDLEAGEVRIVIEADTDAKAENFGWERYLP
jgi:hypothetical protein